MSGKLEGQTIHIGYKRSGNFIVPTLNSIDSKLLIADRGGLVAFRDHKALFLFQEPDTTTSSDTEDDETIQDQINTQIKAQVGANNVGGNYCLLPLSANLSVTLTIAAGVDVFFAGGVGGIQVEIGIGLFKGDDRLYGAQCYFILSLYFKMYFLMYNFEMSVVLVSRAAEVYADNFDHLVDVLTYIPSRIYDDSVTKEESIAQEVHYIHGTRSMRFGSAAEVEVMVGNYGVLGNKSVTRDVFVSTQSGRRWTGSTSRTEIHIIAQEFLKGSFDLDINMYWEEVKGNFNPDNNGVYKGFNLELSKTFEDSNTKMTSREYNKLSHIRDRYTSLGNGGWTVKLHHYLKSLGDVFDNDISRFISRLAYEKDNEIRKIVSDIKSEYQGSYTPPRYYAKRKTVAFKIGVNANCHYVEDNGEFERQYTRAALISAFNVEWERWKRISFATTIVIGFEIDISAHIALIEFPGTETESYIKTVYNGLGINLRNSSTNNTEQNFKPYYKNHKQVIQDALDQETEKEVMTYLEDERNEFKK